MKNIIRKIKNWLIDKLGGYTKEDMNFLYKSEVAVHNLLLQAWVKTVQEICRKSNDTYYDWCCEYCAERCVERNSWCEKFEPRIRINNERRSAEES